MGGPTSKRISQIGEKGQTHPFGDGKVHVVTNDDFIMALEEIEEKEKEKEEGKERQKEACVKAKKSKMIKKKMWEEALEGWKLERERWDEMRMQLREDGCHKYRISLQK